MKPNSQQKKLIEDTEGIYLVDAGAGTGKTFTITRRYVNTIENKDVDPENVLLVTFTNNAAEEMKKKVVDLSKGYTPAKLREAPICTFHSLCKRIMDTHGLDAPSVLGIDDNITSSIQIIENEVLERQEFRNFMNQFIDRNPKYTDFFRILRDYTKLLDLIKSLAAKGIFPAKDDWFMNGEEYLNGDFDEFKDIFEAVNKSEGRKQSELRSRLNSFDNKCYTSDAPEKEEIRGGYGCKQVMEKFAEEAFKEDRQELKQFVHDVYFEYIKYALSRNYLNFSFLMMFAYVLLHQDHRLRDELNYQYVMIDEFQDTSEIQFKLSLLLAEKDNVCAVGDWKQSIYSFQYADVNNIRNFEKRLRKYKQELNSDYTRIDYPVEEVKRLSLTKNYRSTQEILDFSEQSLALEASGRENLDRAEVKKKITSLESEKEKKTPTKINAFESENEKEAILEKIQEIVGNPRYRIGDGEPRKPKYEDIVVLTRTSKFGLKLQEKARDYGIPLVYEGGTEIFKTDPGIILLAWLRILDYIHSKRGWSVVLEEAGYNFDEIKYILDKRKYPENMMEFREELEESRDISEIARNVFNKYGANNAFADKIIEVLQSTFNTTYMNTGRLIQFMEDNIEYGVRYNVDNSPEKNVVKVRTIHAEKGLEHPIVFVSDINNGRFPSTTSSSKRIDYEDPIGLRQKKKYCDDEVPYVYDNWKAEILFKCLSGDYDEERRLMYVAMTRAKRYLFFTSECEKSSKFFEGLNIESEKIEPELEKVEGKEREIARMKINEPKFHVPIKRSVHSIMEIEDEEGEKGKEHGRRVHLFAEEYASGKNVTPENEDEMNIKNFLDSLEGKLRVEENCFLPLQGGKRKIMLKGVMDLVQVTEDSVRLVDYKTDRSRENQEEYRKQLSVYYHVLKRIYSKRSISANIFYSYEGELVEINPLSENRLIDITEE